MQLRSTASRLAAGTLAALFGLVVATALGNVLVGVIAATVGAATVISARATTDATIAVDRLGADRMATGMRMVLTAAMLAEASDGLAAPLAYAVSAVAIQGLWTIVVATVVGSATFAPPLAVRNIDGLPPLPRALRDSHGVTHAATVAFNLGDLAALSLIALTVAVGMASAWAWVAAAVVVGVVSAVASKTVIPAVQQLRSGGLRGYEARLQDRLTALAPQVVVHLSAGAGQARYILNQWLPALEAMTLKGLIVVREPSQLPAIGQTRLPVVLAPTSRDVEALVLPTVRVAFYLANGGLNVHLLREPRLKHVFLNHGDSDKSTSANPFTRVYDEIWVAGQAGIDRYHAAGIDLPLERFAIVGRPQVEGLTIGPLQSGRRTPTVLYAPTFEGYFEESNYSSLERMGPALVRRLLAEWPGVRLLFKPHPATGQERPSMARALRAVEEELRSANERGGEHVLVDDAGVTLIDAFDQADVLVSDVSSVVTDFLWTERPIITSNPRGLSHDRYAELFPTQRASYILDADLGNLADVMDAALGADPLLEPRLQMKRYVLGDLPQGPMKAFIEQAERVYADATEAAGRIHNTFTFSDDELSGPTG